MGLICGCECPKCGYTFSAFVGIGFTYPKVYAEAVEKLKQVSMGHRGKNFLKPFQMEQ